MNTMRRIVVLATAVVLASANPWRVRVAAQEPVPVSDVDPHITALLDRVSEERLRALLTTLVSFQTRNTLSSADSPTRGIGAARQWILDELKRSSPRLQVTFDTYRIPSQGE